MVERPVIILGSPRAGTSVLGRFLEAHPAMTHVKEPRLVWRYGNDGYSDLLGADRARPDVIRYIQGKFDDLVKAAPGGGTLLEKTPSNSLRVPFIEKIFPDARYIHITRNGFDAALSIRWYWLNFTKGLHQGRQGSKDSILKQRLKEMHPRQAPYYAAEFLGRVMPRIGKDSGPRTLWGPRLPGMREMVRDMDLLEVCAMQWRTCAERARMDGMAFAPDRYLEVKLEDISQEKIAEAFAFLDLDFHPQAQTFFDKEFTPGMNESRRKDLSALTDEDRMRLRRVLTPTMDWLGYEEPT